MFRKKIPQTQESRTLLLSVACEDAIQDLLRGSERQECQSARAKQKMTGYESQEGIKLRKNKITRKDHEGAIISWHGLQNPQRGIGLVNTCIHRFC